jgi:hypothetical protein
MQDWVGTTGNIKEDVSCLKDLENWKNEIGTEVSFRKVRMGLLYRTVTLEVRTARQRRCYLLSGKKKLYVSYLLLTHCFPWSGRK